MTEWTNTTSSLVMVFYGAWLLFVGRHINPLPKQMAALLIMVGTGSVLYHATLYYGFGLLDAYPMILLMGAAINALLNEVSHERIRGGKYRQFAVGVFYLLSSLYVLGCLVATIFSDRAFRVLFGMPFILVVALMFWFYFDKRMLPGKPPQVRVLKVTVRRTLVSGSIGFGFWLFDLLLCPAWVGVAYFFGHVIWHVFIGYMAMAAIALVSHLLTDNYGYRPSLTYKWSLFPVVDYEGKDTGSS